MTEILGKRSAGLLSDKVTKKIKGQSAPSKTSDNIFEDQDPEETNNKKSIKQRKKQSQPNNSSENDVHEEGVNTKAMNDKGKGKKVYLKPHQIEAKIKELQQRVDELSGPENFSKRKRIYQRLIQLKKALANPEELLIDPEEELRRVAEDKQRRIQKKIDKARRQKKANSKTQRHKHDYCIICKTQGHVAEDCREGKSDPSLAQELGRHICFNCGKADHSLKDCPDEKGQYLSFATCFYCKEKGHLSRDCPQNEQGIYHKGGSCFECGSKRHLAKECPIRNGLTNGNITNEQERKSQKIQNDDEEDYEEQADENDIFSDNE